MAGEISHALDLSLAAVGVLAGTVFFSGLVVAKLGAARLTARVGADTAVRATCAAAVAGNLILAVSPDFAGLAVGRLLAGISLGLALVLGPVLARTAGGVTLVGIFGGSVTIGVAGALGVGGLLRASGADWRLDFVISAALAAAALALIPRLADATIASGSVLAIARRALRASPAWRLELVFTTALGIPYVLGVWLVPHLTEDVGLSAGIAGLLGVSMFALTAFLRPEGAHLDREGRSLTVLGGLAPIAAALGLVLLAFADGAVVAVLAVVLAGVGFAIPYASMYGEAERLYPGARIASVGLLSVGGNVLPLVATPVVGGAIEGGDGGLALAALAVIPLLAGLLNLRPAAPRTTAAD